MPRLSLPGGLALLALLLAALFLIDLPDRTLWQATVLDLGHGPVFAGIAGVLMAMRPPSAAAGRRSLTDYAAVLGVCAALGVLTELLQAYLPDRNVSAHDVMNDVAGALFGLAGFALLERRPQVQARWAWAALLVAVLVLAWPPLQVARAYAERRAAFPTLAPLRPPAAAAFVAARQAQLDFAELPAAFVEPNASPEALRLRFAPGARPALEFVEPTRDWRGWSTLALDVTNPGDAPTHWILRILDAEHDWSHEDRFNLPVTIPPRTRTTVRVSVAAIGNAPRARAMDLGAISNVMLFATAPPVGTTEFYVSRVWLE